MAQTADPTMGKILEALPLKSLTKAKESQSNRWTNMRWL